MHVLKKSFRDPVFCVWSSFLAATAVAFLLGTIQGVPVPRVHDEFAYLLGADTYAAGRITNPTHPMWQHFETFHVIHRPTYIDKYQPAQALTLAAGKVLGHAFIGACLATGISIAALVWMLAGWLPRRYLWLIWLFAVFHPGLQIFWGQSYWGGAVPLTGAALLLGALGRANSQTKISTAIIAAIGILLLANSRPFEGAVLTAAVGVGLIWKFLSNPSWQFRLFFTRLIIPGATTLALGIGAMLTNNYFVTGDALTMPYQIHEAEYGWSPLFLWQTAKAKPNYRHPEMERVFALDKKLNELEFQSISDVLRVKVDATRELVKFFCGGAELLALCGLPWLLRKSRFRLALVLLVPVFLAALATPWAWAHYAAPAAPLIILLMMGGWIEVWKRTRVKKLRIVHGAMIGLMPFLYASWFWLVYLQQHRVTHSGWSHDRQHIEEKLCALSGRDLVLVRYPAEHNPSEEWVYNAADIDQAEVVWAREISDQRRSELLRYFAGRKVWIVEVGNDSSRLRAFEENEHPIVKTQKTRRPWRDGGGFLHEPLGAATRLGRVVRSSP